MEDAAIREELKEIQQRIKELKKDFFDKKKVKEDFFTAGEEFSAKINSLYEDVKKIEEENNLDVVNKELEDSKAEYDSIKENYEKLKAEFESMIKSRPRKKVQHKEGSDKVHRISPQKAQKQLEQLELKVQTQVLSLEKEAEVAREIAELKELAGKQKEVETVEEVVEESEGSEETPEDTNFKSVKKEYYDLRKKYNAIEKKIRSLYKQIRLISKEKKQRYKEIDNLRDQKKEAFENFREHKKTYMEVGKELKDLFKKEEEYLTQLGEELPVKKKKTYNSNKSDGGFNKAETAKKQKEAEDLLMKKGAKLTTEDLLALQKRK